MTDAELLGKVSQACYSYRALYGNFPDKIGIHYRRLSHWSRSYVVFPELPPLPKVDYTDPEKVESIAVHPHVTHFEPVAGQDIQWDEVYLALPGMEPGCISGERVARMAKEFV